ncbi:hypothetical protein GCM10022214_02020 [Actinomadura miaoliensis]|uniref:Uncharacterized protein n=1 Tax=Actinomadura miaoliensis TaxID=430685 RepID=A0ABP7UZ62_9ACTN
MDLERPVAYLAAYRAPAALIAAPPPPPYIPPLEKLGFVYVVQADGGAFEDFRARILQATSHLLAVLEHGSTLPSTSRHAFPHLVQPEGPQVPGTHHHR